MSIQGLPGASNPTFRTWDERYITLDSVVGELGIRLIDEDMPVAVENIKSIIQTARRVLNEIEEPDVGDLGGRISVILRGQRLLLPSALCLRVLQLYATVLLELDVAEVLE